MGGVDGGGRGEEKRKGNRFLLSLVILPGVLLTVLLVSPGLRQAWDTLEAA